MVAKHVTQCATSTFNATIISTRLRLMATDAIVPTRLSRSSLAKRTPWTASVVTPKAKAIQNARVSSKARRAPIEIAASGRTAANGIASS